MTALSIRNMHYTMAHREQAGTMADLDARRERSRYWFIEKRVKRGGKLEWSFVRDYIGTKREAADLFVKFYRHNRTGKFRLVHKLSY